MGRHQRAGLNKNPWEETMRSLVCGLLAATVFAFSPLTDAHAWPDKPVTLIVNAGVGGAPDVLARMYGTHLAEALGKPFIVENRAGAGGNLGVEAVARAAADGHTLLVSPSSSFVIGPHIYKLNFDAVKDLTPVAAVAATPMYLVVRPNLEAKNVAELIALARANPGKLTFGSAGIGTLPHIAGETLLHTAKIKAVHVPYKGSGDALTGLLRGEVDFVFDPGVSIPQVKAGKVRLLAVGSSTRMPSLPDTPTLIEAGTGMTAVSIVGVYAPTGTPAAVVTQLNREINRLAEMPKVKATFASMSAQPVTLSPQDFAAMLAKDRERFGVVVREANIKVQR
jgi:tripartite-type tricarboxylate transporter receptor subunit TctC